MDADGSRICVLCKDVGVTATFATEADMNKHLQAHKEQFGEVLVGSRLTMEQCFRALPQPPAHNHPQINEDQETGENGGGTVNGESVEVPVPPSPAHHLAPINEEQGSDAGSGAEGKTVHNVEPQSPELALPERFIGLVRPLSVVVNKIAMTAAKVQNQKEYEYEEFPEPSGSNGVVKRKSRQSATVAAKVQKQVKTRSSYPQPATKKSKKVEKQPIIAQLVEAAGLKESIDRLALSKDGLVTCQWTGCGKQMSAKNTFNVVRDHVLVHANARPFVCSNCPKIFTRLDSAKKHIDNKHKGEQAQVNISLKEQQDELAEDFNLCFPEPAQEAEPVAQG